MSLLTKKSNSTFAGAYLSTFAKLPVYGSTGIPMKVLTNENDELSNSGKSTTVRMNQKEISDAVQKKKRGAISIKSSQLDAARKGANGEAIALQGLAPEQIDVVDRVYRGRQASLGLDNPEGSVLYDGYLKEGSKATRAKRKQAKNKRQSAKLTEKSRASSATPTGIESETVGDLLEQSQVKQKTATRSNTGTGAAKPIPGSGNSAVQSERLLQRKQALKDSKQIDAFYKKLKSGTGVTPADEEEAIAALQKLVEQKRTIRGGSGSKVTPVEDLLSSSKKVDYITRNAKPVEIDLDVAAKNRLKNKVAKGGTLPSYVVRNEQGVVDPRKASYTPAQRPEGITSAIGRRAAMLDEVKATLNAADEQTDGNASSIGREGLYKALKAREAGTKAAKVKSKAKVPFTPSASRAPSVLPNAAKKTKEVVGDASTKAKTGTTKVINNIRDSASKANVFGNVSNKLRNLSTGGKLKAAAGILGVVGAGAVAGNNLLALNQQAQRNKQRNKPPSNAPDYDYDRFNIRY
jgi:hypothetical protein